MVAPAIPYVILGVFFTVSVCLYIGGCAICKNWYPLFTIIPALLTCLCAYAFVKSEPNDGYSEAKITEDGYLFLLVVCVVSAVGLPLVLYHVGTLDGKALGFHLAGDASTAIGFGVFMFLTNNESY